MRAGVISHNLQPHVMAELTLIGQRGHSACRFGPRLSERFNNRTVLDTPRHSARLRGTPRICLSRKRDVI